MSYDKTKTDILYKTDLRKTRQTTYINFRGPHDILLLNSWKVCAAWLPTVGEEKWAKLLSIASIINQRILRNAENVKKKSWVIQPAWNRKRHENERNWAEEGEGSIPNIPLDPPMIRMKQRWLKLKFFEENLKSTNGGGCRILHGGGGKIWQYFWKPLWNLEKFGPQGRLPNFITGQDQRNFIRTTLPVIDSNWL